MIQRLKKIEVERFRAYRSPTTINLDGNVVLIHGRNGSGKTSLMAAIEYAVTGSVAHLSRFASDYPNVLQHHGADDPAAVRLWATTSGEEVFVERTVGQRTPTGGKALSKSAQAAFVDRCYLSQTHLSQLLHVYQAAAKKSKKGPKDDAPVIRFIRDFLDLDHLEAVEKGLHVPADIRRLRNTFPEYAALEPRLAEAQTAAETARTAADGAVAAEREAKEALIVLSQRLGLPAPSESLEEILEAATVAEIDASADVERFGGWANTLSAPSQPGDAGPPALPVADLGAVRAPLADAARALSGALDRLEPTGPGVYRLVEVSDDDNARAFKVATDEAQALRSWLARARADLATSQETAEAGLRRATDETAEIAALRARTAEIQDELAGLVALSAAAVGEVQQRQQMLSEALAHVDDDVCPVCDRNFAETGGSLRNHVTAELERLGAATTQLQEQIRRRDALVKESATAEARASKLAADAPEDRALALRQRLASLSAVPPLLTSVSEALDRLGEPLAALDRRARAEADRRAWQASHEAVSRAAEEAWAALGTPDLPGDLLTPAALSTLGALVVQRAAEHQNRVAAYRETRTQVQALREARNATQKAKARAETADQELNRLSDMRSRVDDLVERARRLRSAAATTTRTLVKRTFDDHLNALVDDLYTRLVRDERFRPRITAKGPIGNLTAAVHAFADGDPDGDPVAQNIAALVSSANLNTAALSLFLALHLAEPTRPRTLVLDDPVQSMDDVHATNLAALFRTLAYHPKDPRQLVLAVHDKALFDYLALELGPTKEGETLIEVEITRESPKRVVAHSTSRSWQPDMVHFGLAS